jgi:hypothetical protein
MKKLVGSVFALVMAGLVVGCASADASKAPEQTGAQTEVALVEGLNILPTTTDIAFNAAYKRDKTVIYMQALRGKETPAEYQKDPASPKFEIDARFVADNGRTFYSRKGGDEWIDPTWAQDFEKQTSLAPTRISNEALFNLAAEATADLEVKVAQKMGSDRAATFVPVLKAIREFGERAPMQFAEQKVRHLEALKKKGLDVSMEIPYGTNGPEDSDWSANANYYYIAVHDKDLSFTFGTGKHSATRLYQWTGAWSWVHDACNHGTCAGDMGIKCLLQYYEAVSDYKPSWTFQNCKTGYDAISNGGHNCHDDTRVQLSNFVYNKSNNGYQAWCNDGDGPSDISGGFERGGSPSCDGYGDRGFHYARWCDYNDNMSCPSSWQGTGDGCDCGCVFPDGSHADPDCSAK